MLWAVAAVAQEDAKASQECQQVVIQSAAGHLHTLSPVLELARQSDNKVDSKPSVT